MDVLKIFPLAIVLELCADSSYSQGTASRVRGQGSDARCAARRYLMVKAKQSAKLLIQYSLSFQMVI